MAPIGKIEEELEKDKAKLTESNLKKIYTYLEKKSNQGCVYIMESLIGIMRNMRKADAVSVELYLKKFEGFMIGLNRIDHKKINFDYCEEYANVIQSQGYRSALEANKEVLMFIPFLDVLEKLCELAKYAKDEVALEEYIEKKEHQILDNIKNIEAKENIQNTGDLATFISDEIKTFQQDQIRILQEKERRVEADLRQAQADLANFDKQFYQEI